MADILIRGLSEDVLNRITNEARERGLSRNEYLRRRLEQTAAGEPTQAISSDDWVRLSRDLEDLADSAVMDSAWL